MDESDAMFSNGEARDDISMLPRAAAIKIFSYLSIVDLYRCAQVCRSWKIITNSNILWSKLDLSTVKDKYIRELKITLLFGLQFKIYN